MTNSPALFIFPGHAHEGTRCKNDDCRRICEEIRPGCDKNPAMKTAVIGLLLALLQTSCNTFIGVSRDMQQLGSGMENLGQRKW